MNYDANAGRWPLLTGLTALALSATSQAQQPPGGWDTTPANGDSTLQEIVVTARKRTESLRDVPESIVAISAAQLARPNVTAVADLASIVPSLTIETGSTNPFTIIRGFGSGNDLSFDQAVGKFIDNVSYGRDQDVRLPLFDVDSVEVLKGPQVLLYGNSSTAGALTVTTRKPGDSFEADGSVAYEFTAREVVAQAAVTLPLTSIASVRFSGLYDDLSKGWVYNSATNQHIPTSHNDAGRVILRLTPTSDLEVMLKAEYDQLREGGFAAEPVAQPTSGLPFPEANHDLVTAYNNDVAPLFQTSNYILHNQTYQADVNLQALGGTFTSTSGYRDMAYTGSTPSGAQLPLLNAWINQEYRQASEELRYSGSVGNFDLTAGVFYQHERFSVFEAVDTNLAALGAPLPPFAFNFGLFERTDSYSGFLDLTYHFTQRFSLEAGSRYSDIRRDALQEFFAGNIVPGKGFDQGAAAFSPNPAYSPLLFALFGVPPHNFPDLQLHEDHVQPQVVAQYKILDKAQVYAKYVKGYKAGGFDVNYEGLPADVSPQGAHFRPERAEAYEVGFKGLTFNDRVSFSLVAFHEVFTDLQANAFVGSSNVTQVTNVGKARSHGIESDMSFAPIAGLKLNASLAWTDARYLDFPGGVCTRAQAVVQPVGCVQNLSGAPTPYSSKWAGVLGVDYQQYFGKFAVMEGASVVARSSYNTSTNHEPLLEQASYAQLDAHVELKPAAGDWSVSVFGRNLTNQHPLVSGDAMPLSTGGLSAISLRGRQIGVQWGVRF